MRSKRCAVQNRVITLRAGGWGSPPATMNVVLSYFHTKIAEK